MKLHRLIGAALCVVLCSVAHAQSKTKAAISVEVTTNLADNSSGAITPAVMRNLFNDILSSYFQGSAVNAQTSTAYTVQCADMGALLTFSNAATVSVSLPGASTTCFNNNWAAFFKNLGAGPVTITPTTGTINGSSSLNIGTGQGFYIASDGTNYQVWSGALSVSLPLSVSNGGTGLTSGTSGGIPYFSSSTTTGSSAALTQFGFVMGGGAGNSPTATAACGNAQVPIGQTSANPICQTVTGDIGINASGTATIAANAVTNTKLATAGAATFKGNPTASTANVQDFTIQGLVARGAPDAANDKIPLFDNAAGTIKYVTPAQVASAATAGVSSLNGLTGALTGAFLNILNTQTANYTIASTDCGKTILAGTGSTGQFTLTLPAVTGFDPLCQFAIYNGDTTTLAGKILAGFPATMTSPNLLLPGQTLAMRIESGVWTAVNPGRWKNPLGQTKWYVNPSGSDSNDCLATGTSRACATAQAALTRAVYFSDNQGATPIINMACGVTHTTALVMGGIPLGTNLVQISPDGNCSFSWFATGSSAPITIGDLAELDLNLTFYGGSGAMSCTGNTTNTTFSAGCIYMHGPAVVLDMEGTPTWFPGGNNDNGLFCDGQCQPIMANGMTQGAGAGNYVIDLSAGGKMTQSGTISGSSGSSATGVFRVFGNATMITGTATAPASTWTGGIGNSQVAGSSLIVTNGLVPAGGINVATTSSACTSLTSNSC